MHLLLPYNDLKVTSVPASICSHCTSPPNTHTHVKLRHSLSADHSNDALPCRTHWLRLPTFIRKCFSRHVKWLCWPERASASAPRRGQRLLRGRRWRRGRSGSASGIHISDSGQTSKFKVSLRADFSLLRDFHSVSVFSQCGNQRCQIRYVKTTR